MNKIEKDDLHPIFIRLPARNIVLLKCIIESYEGIAEVRTLDNNLAVVVLLAMEDTKKTAYEIISSEKKSLEAEVIEKPLELTSSDWLLSYLED
jgi:hypothetical protein